MTTREQLIHWAAYCYGRAAASGRYDAEHDRACAMRDTVDAATHTPAARIRFYLRFVEWTFPRGPVTPAARWRFLHRKARHSNRHGGGDRDRFLEQLVFELTAGLNPAP